MAIKKTFDNNRINPELMAGDSPFREKLLVAMPGMADGLFSKSVVYLCAHSDAGAMGIIVNQTMPDFSFADLLSQLQLPKSRLLADPVVHFGGPVDGSRGFVLHSPEYRRPETLALTDQLCLTGTVDILRAIAEDRGPRHLIFALGYAGWGPGQLEMEMQENSWLTVPADDDLLFGTDLSHKWEKAMARIGITPQTLSSHVGHA